MLRAEWGGRVDCFDDQCAMVWKSWELLAGHGSFLGMPWYSLNREIGDEVPVPTVLDLREDMLRASQEDQLNYGFTTLTLETGDNEPNMMMNVHLSDPRGWRRGAANSAYLSLDGGCGMGRAGALPVDWLLSIGISLVMDFVDVWDPDAASLDCLELMRLRPAPPNVEAKPVVGFFSWFSDDVVGPVGLPTAFMVKPYKNGTLVGIDPRSSDPLSDAMRLSSRVDAVGCLKLIPFVQGEPNPD